MLFISVGDEDTGRVDHDLIDGVEELLLLNISHYERIQIKGGERRINVRSQPRVRLRKNEDRK